MSSLAVMLSGEGTILAAMIAEGIEIRVVLADRACRGLEVATAAGIGTVLVKRTDFSRNFDRLAFTELVVVGLRPYQPSLIAMAGFMTVLSPVMFQVFEHVLNTHPSLLPAFKGPNAVQDALDYGVKITGCTILRATKKLDEGPILAQAAVPVLEGDTEETLHERIKVEERRLYPATIRQMKGQ